MTAPFTLALAQLNPVVGDLSGNAAKILDVYRAHETTADLVVFSELVLSGYPTDDLVLNPAFVDRAMAEAEKLARQTGKGAGLLIGAPWREDGRVYNAALLLHDGKIVEKRFKHHLPNYGVFDEARVFSAGPLPQPVTFREARLGILTCEDMWYADVSAHLKRAGADILIVPNGSPYETGKNHIRLEHARARAAETGLPLVYVNQVGGQDELVFDGASFVIDPAGKVLTQLPAFREYVSTTVWGHDSPSPLSRDEREREGPVLRSPQGEAGWEGEGRCNPQSASALSPRPLPACAGRGGFSCKSFEAPCTLPEGPPSIYQALVLGLKDYVGKSGFPGVLIGLSGGIDSALTAAVAADALGASRVRTVMMPSPYTSEESLEDATACAKLLGVSHETISIAPAMTAFDEMLKGAQGITAENIQARSRGLLLMALSNATGHMVLSTGNKSEMSVGYATLYGDMCGGFNVLKDVYKMTVFELSKWRNTQGRVIPERIITKPPSAELRPNQKDEDSLPPYPVLDAILHALVEEEKDIAAIVAEGHALGTVQRVRTMLDRAEYKRRQSCPGVKITSKAFGRDRRYPIVNGFTGSV